MQLPSCAECLLCAPHGSRLWVQGTELLRAELEGQAAALDALRRDIDAADSRRAAEQQATWTRCTRQQSSQTVLQ